MEAILPLVAALVLFPAAFLVPKAREHPNGYLLPAVLTLPFVGAMVLGAGPPYINALFVFFGVGISWRWRTTVRPTSPEG